MVVDRYLNSSAWGSLAAKPKTNALTSCDVLENAGAMPLAEVTRARIIDGRERRQKAESGEQLSKHDARSIRMGARRRTRHGRSDCRCKNVKRRRRAVFAFGQKPRSSDWRALAGRDENV